MHRCLHLLINSVLVAVLVVVRPNTAAAESASKIDLRANLALSQLYSESSVAKELGARASGILVFPIIFKGGLFFVADYGKGVLRVANSSQGYYNVTASSIGVQIGLSTRSLVIMFMTEEVLAKFSNSDRWEPDLGADVAIIDAEVAGTFNMTTVQDPIIAFRFREEGLMAGFRPASMVVRKLNN